MDTGGYKVLIYHTHGSEAFADSRPGEVDDTVIGLGNRLAEILTDTYGIPVYHDTTAYDMMTGFLTGTLPMIIRGKVCHRYLRTILR